MISVLFLLFFSCFHFFNENVYLEIMTVELARLFPLRSGLSLCDLVKALLIHRELNFLRVNQSQEE